MPGKEDVPNQWRSEEKKNIIINWNRLLNTSRNSLLYVCPEKYKADRKRLRYQNKIVPKQFTDPDFT